MKVGLVLCPQWDASWPVFPLALLAAELQARGHEVRLYDVNKEMALLAQASRNEAFRQFPTLDAVWSDPAFVEEQILPAHRPYVSSLVERILSGGARVVGFSVYFSNWAMSLAVARLIKEADPGIQVVFGGPSCHKLEQCLKFIRLEGVDAVVYGEGDRSFPSFVSGLERSGRAEPAPGLLLRQDPATWKADQDFVVNLDELPYADFAGFRLSLYVGKTLHTCRGCVRHCVFCNWGRQRRYRYMSGPRVFGELLHQLEKDPGVREFFFCDSLVNGVMKSLSSFCDLVLENGLEIGWGGYAIVRPEMTPEFLDKLRRAGCRSLIYGVESGSGRVLKEMEKYVEPALNARVFRDTARAGIRTIATMMVGFPTEGEDDFQDTLEFVRSNAESIGHLSPSIFSIEDMMGEWDRYGMVPTDHALYWRTRDAKNTFPERLRRLRRLLDTALQSGVDARFEGRIAPAEMASYYGMLLERYESWEASVKAPARLGASTSAPVQAPASG